MAAAEQRPLTNYHRDVQQVMLASRAPSTVFIYKRASGTWSSCCITNGVSVLPNSRHDVARYFLHLRNTGSPFSTIETAFYAIKWHIDCSPLASNNPCDTKFLKLLLDGMKRFSSRPVVRKEPITAEMLHKIVLQFGHSNKLTDIRMCAILLISFAGFFRNEELINLRMCDTKIFPSHVQFDVRKSKTDQYYEGAKVMVSATGLDTCPVAMLNKFVKLSGLNDVTSDDYLFKPLTFKKQSQSHVPKKGKLSYSTCRDILKGDPKAIGEDATKFGLHSLRAGGATAAATVGIPDRLIKKHGRWKTDRLRLNTGT